VTTPKKRKPSSSELVPASPGELVIDGDMNNLAEQLVDQARADGIALTGEGGLLPQLIARVLETGLAVEMTDHLGYEPNAAEGNNTGNSRNGSFPKTVTTEVGEVDLRVPRDRAGTFDPVLVPHGERRVDGLAGQVISLYGQGLTTGEICDHLEETYGTSISKDTVSRMGVLQGVCKWGGP
jgi:transposase-like protein